MLATGTTNVVAGGVRMKVTVESAIMGCWSACAMAATVRVSFSTLSPAWLVPPTRWSVT